MGPLLNRNKNPKHLNEEFDQNVDNIPKKYNFWCNVVDSLSFIRKRNKPDEDGKENTNKLNGNELSEINRQKDLLLKKLEENELKARKLKVLITKKDEELDELNEVIKNIKNDLIILEEYEEIKSNLIEKLNSQILNQEKENNVNDSTKVIKNFMNEYWNNNQNKFLSLYQSLNQNLKNSIKSEINGIEKLYQKTYLQTMILKKNYFENENSLSTDEILKAHFNFKENKPPKKEINHNNIINNNTSIIKNFDQYSFKCLTNNLDKKILKGTKEVSIEIELENNGEFPWPKNETFLLIDESKSRIKSENIMLDGLIPNKQKIFNIKFKNLENLKPGIYKINLSFLAKGKTFGNNITINIEVYEKD